MVTSYCGLSTASRCVSEIGDPAVKLPVLITTISGHPSQSRNVVPGRRCSVAGSAPASREVRLSAGRGDAPGPRGTTPPADEGACWLLAAGLVTFLAWSC